MNAIKQVWRDARSWGELRKTPYGLTPAIVMGLTFFFAQFSTQAFGLARVEVTRDLDITFEGIIGVTQIVSVIAIFCALAAGWWADRHARVPLLAGGAIFGSFFSAATGATQSEVQLGAARIGDTVGDLAAGVPRYSLLSDYYPAETRGKVFSVIGTISGLAAIISPIPVALLINNFGWRSVFVATSIPLFVMGVVTAIKLREPIRGYFERKAVGLDDDEARAEDEPQSFGESWRTVWSIRTLRRLFIADIFGNIGSDIFSLFFLFFLAEEYGLGVLGRALVFLPATIFGVAGGFIGGGLVDALGRRNPARVLTVVGLFPLVTAVAYFGYGLRPPIALIVGFSCLRAFGSALIGPGVNAIYSQVIPPSIRTLGLQVGLLAQLPAVFALSFGGILLFTYGYATVFYFCAGMAVISGLIQASAGPFFDVDRRNAFSGAAAANDWKQARKDGKGKLLVCRDVDVEYDGVQVLFGVDFDVEDGEIIALLGTNGAGKSTLLRAISGSTEASGGAIVFNGRDITHMPPHEIAGRGAIQMPGGRGVFPGLTVRENLLLGNWMLDDEEEVVRRLQEVYEIFPVLHQRIDTVASSLSGGEQQQLSLAQAFLARPQLLMIDELSLGLSPAVVGQLIEVVREIHRRGTTIIVVEQSINVALTLAEKAIFMEKGEVKFFGQTKDLLARPDILRAVYVKGSGGGLGGTASAARTERDQRAMELDSARSILEVEGLVKRYGGVNAVNDVSFQLREGEVLGLIGPNGAGKTTIFDIVSGYQKADAGLVRLDGVDVTGMRPEERARSGMIRRFQDARLFSALSVYETLLVALEERLEVKSTFLTAVQMPQARRAEKRLRLQADRLIELLDLGSYRDKFVKELSTGLRRIVDLACVLGTEPKVLLLDEPSSGIAQAEAEGLAPLLRRVRFETGCSILIIEHDMPLISRVSDELIALDQGAVVTRGAPQSVLDDARVIEAYLGTSEEAISRSGSLA